MTLAMLAFLSVVAVGVFFDAVTFDLTYDCSIFSTTICRHRYAFEEAF